MSLLPKLSCPAPAPLSDCGARTHTAAMQLSALHTASCHDVWTNLLVFKPPASGRSICLLAACVSFVLARLQLCLIGFT